MIKFCIHLEAYILIYFDWSKQRAGEMRLYSIFRLTIYIYIALFTEVNNNISMYLDFNEIIEADFVRQLFLAKPKNMLF